MPKAPTFLSRHLERMPYEKLAALYGELMHTNQPVGLAIDPPTTMQYPAGLTEKEARVLNFLSIADTTGRNMARHTYEQEKQAEAEKRSQAIRDRLQRLRSK